ncbi:hypothetical protein RIF29_38297 [Crotalaria pallida]|uniref:Uncharacterized protein n=1 Tax=Crotalaria pallida TaxID=3830 RepID=A0AAN9DYY2_CROPI
MVRYESQLLYRRNKEKSGGEQMTSLLICLYISKMSALRSDGILIVFGDEVEDFHNSKKIRGEHPSVSSQSLGVVSEVAGSSSKLVPGLDDNSPPCIVKVRISRLTINENSQDKSFLSKDTDIIEGDGKKLSKLGKCRSRLSKTDSALDCGADVDGDHVHGPPSTREEKGLVHVARKMPKNGHAHFILGLMYQRLSQPQKRGYVEANEVKDEWTTYVLDELS